MCNTIQQIIQDKYAVEQVAQLCLLKVDRKSEQCTNSTDSDFLYNILCNKLYKKSTANRNSVENPQHLLIGCLFVVRLVKQPVHTSSRKSKVCD